MVERLLNVVIPLKRNLYVLLVVAVRAGVGLVTATAELLAKAAVLVKLMFNAPLPEYVNSVGVDGILVGTPQAIPLASKVELPTVEFESVNVPLLTRLPPFKLTAPADVAEFEIRVAPESMVKVAPVKVVPKALLMVTLFTVYVPEEIIGWLAGVVLFITTKSVVEFEPG